MERNSCYLEHYDRGIGSKVCFLGKWEAGEGHRTHFQTDGSRHWQAARQQNA